MGKAVKDLQGVRMDVFPPVIMLIKGLKALEQGPFSLVQIMPGFRRFLSQILPQHDPGPAHPGACPGLEPQQAVSEGPGMFLGLWPVRLDVADMSLVRSLLPHPGHSGEVVVENISSSLTFPQFSHRYS